jgi:hypothetical protein
MGSDMAVTTGFVFVPPHVLTPPAHGLNWVFRDHFWMYDENKGLAFWRDGKAFFPQCNASESIVEKLASEIGPEGVTVIYQSFVCVKADSEGRLYLPEKGLIT